MSNEEIKTILTKHLRILSSVLDCNVGNVSLDTIRVTTSCIVETANMLIYLNSAGDC